MERDEAIRRMKTLVGKDLFNEAESCGISVWKNGKLNKGWFGHVIEHFLGLPLNSAQAPNFGSWELKTTSLKRKANGAIVPKETIAITMIDKYNVIRTPFLESHLYSKLKKIVLVARIVSEKFEASGLVHSVVEFDLTDKQLLKDIEADYELVRSTLKAHDNGDPADNDVSCLSGRMGKYIQPRTKGAGHGTTSRAFYMRKCLVGKILGL